MTPLLGVLLVASLSFAALSPSLGAADTTVPVLIEDQPEAIGDPPSVAGMCVLSTGTLGCCATIFGDEGFTALATALNPSACSCPLAGIVLNSVSFRVAYLSACSATAEISVVGSIGGACPAPDLARVLCPPVTHTISSAPPRWGRSNTHTLPMPSGCCIQEPAFVLVRFIGFDLCPYPKPGLMDTTSPTCASCLQYVSITNLYPTLTDWCVLSTGRIWVSVDADCCDPTPTLPDSWGRLKTIYR